MRRADTLIVGGGPAGTAAAITLAQAGRQALLLERKAQPGGIVCGGFVGWDALKSLETLGVDAMALGAAPIHGLRLVAGGRVIEARLPHRAVGLSRAVLDTALLARVRACGAVVEQGVAVKRVEGRTADPGGERVAANHLIVATGKHALRGAPRLGTPEGSVGLRAAVPAPVGLAGWIELHLFQGGYGGVLVQEDGRANLCLSVAAARLRQVGGTPAALIAVLAREAPALAAHAAGATDWDAIAGVPYGWLAPAGAPAYRVGDQAAVIASLAGDGIAVALASGRAAAGAILTGTSPTGFQRGFTRRASGPIGRAEAIRRIAEAPVAAGRAAALLAHAPWAATLAARLTRIGS